MSIDFISDGVGRAQGEKASVSGRIPWPFGEGFRLAEFRARGFKDYNSLYAPSQFSIERFYPKTRGAISSNDVVAFSTWAGMVESITTNWTDTPDTFLGTIQTVAAKAGGQFPALLHLPDAVYWIDRRTNHETCLAVSPELLTGVSGDANRAKPLVAEMIQALTPPPVIASTPPEMDIGAQKGRVLIPPAKALFIAFVVFVLFIPLMVGRSKTQLRDQ